MDFGLWLRGGCVLLDLVALRVRPPRGRGRTTRGEVSGGRSTGAIGYRDAAGQVRHYGARNGLVREGIRPGARIHVCVRVEAALILEHWAVFDDARRGRARSYGAREHTAVPAVQEVAVQPVASRVPICENKASAVVHSVEWCHVKVYLIEDGDKVDRMRVWA